jgi:hypothetical protein
MSRRKLKIHGNFLASDAEFFSVSSTTRFAASLWQRLAQKTSYTTRRIGAQLESMAPSATKGAQEDEARRVMAIFLNPQH